MNEDRASKYQRLKRTSGIVSFAWSAILLALLLLTGASAALRDLAQSSGAWAPQAVRATIVAFIYVALLMIVNEVGGLPLSFYGGFLLERRYGLSNQRLADWLADQAKGFVVSLVLGGAAASIIYFLIRRSPDGWWLPAGVTFALLIVGLANLGPVLLLPLFYSVKPLDREALRVRLLSLAERAGARVLGAYEWGLAAKTKKANAALAGLAGTRRILVSDTMLADYTDEEIEVVLAHEMAHHVHGDIWKGLIFESVLVLAGFFARRPGLERPCRVARAGGARGPRRHAAAAAGCGRRVADHVAGRPRVVTALRAERRSIRAGTDAQSRRVHFRDAAPRRAEPRRGPPVEGRRMAVLQPPADSRAHCRGAAVCSHERNPPAALAGSLPDASAWRTAAPGTRLHRRALQEDAALDRRGRHELLLQRAHLPRAVVEFEIALLRDRGPRRRRSTPGSSVPTFSGSS